MTERSPDVLVVGGGPVGLALACELGRHGVRCRLIDKNPAPQVWSKAAVTTPRTLEALRDMGVVDAFLARGRPMHGFNLHRGLERLAHVTIQLEGTPFPYLFGISQRDTELLLAEHLARSGGTLERNVELVSLDQDAGSVHARLRHADGSEESLSVPWLVGCDGARSTVRQALGLSFEGSTFEQIIWQADIRIDWPFEVDPHEAYAFPSDHGMCGALPLLADGRYRLLLLAPPDPDREPTLESLQEVAYQRLPEGTRIHDPAWIVAFRFHGRIADRYRVGRAFLAGDAGHIHSPVGGQGMNLGIQDAYNLGWKLALVARGVAPEQLLDSYETERRPIAEEIVNGTDRVTRGMARVLKLRHPLAIHLRNQVISMVMETGLFQSQAMQTLSGVRVGYPDSPIVAEHQGSVWMTEIGERRDERPGLRDWMRFADGPGPGARVPDTDLPSGAPASTLHELLIGTEHVLLLFDGAASTATGYENLSAIAGSVEARYGALVRVFVIVPQEAPPEALRWRRAVLLDADSALHGHFGCGSEGLYLIRPDGYVAFRSQPADAGSLMEYLGRIFTGGSGS